MSSYRYFFTVMIALAIFNWLQAGDFTLENSPELKVGFSGKPLLLGDGISYRENYSLPTAQSVFQSGPGLHGAKVSNLYDRNPAFSWRREAAVSADGREVEITFQARVPSYAVSGGESRESLAYFIRLDAARLNGMKFKAWQGRTHKPSFSEGVVRASVNGPLYRGTARYLSIEGKGINLVFDFNPEGVTSYSDAGPGTLQGMWSASVKDGQLILQMTANLDFWGGCITGKLVMFEGKFDDFRNRHAETKYSYSDDMDYTRAFVFGAKKFGKFYTDVNTALFSESRRAGWLGNRNLRVINYAPSGAVYSAVASSEPATFKVTDLQPGVYMVTVRSAAYNQAVGPAKIELNGFTAALDFSLRTQETGTVTFPVWIEQGTAEFRFSGKWQVSALVMQFLMHSKEDFKFRRGIWHLQAFEPGPLFRNADYAQPPQFQVAVDKTRLAPYRFKATEPYQLDLKSEVLLPEDEEAMAWRYNGVLGSLGPGNNGDLSHFDTPAEKKRRIAELKKDHINVVIINGLLSRHTFPRHLDRVTGFVREMVAEAHRQNLRMIDHQDLTLLWNKDSGFRVMTERTDSLLHRIDGEGVARAFCPVNPHTRQEYFDRTVQYIRETGLDGLMVDEVYFLSSRHCGCRFCREKFTADTGLILPMDETSPDLFNTERLIWKAWLTWRQKALGDWWVDFRREVNQVKPDFSFLRYTTHYGWASTFGSLNKGCELIENGYAIDFLGTEIMSRNSMVSRRPVMAFRKMKSSLNLQFKKPVFGLVYPGGDWSISYFGWALNNMNRQVTWFTQPPPRTAGLPDYFTFQENYPLRYVGPAARTAVLFSGPSRDWAKNFPYANDVLGTSEALTDTHLMHECVLPETISDREKMKDFRNLLVMSARCLSDAEIKGIRDFAERGGTVFLSVHSGTADRLGMERNQWPFEDIFGFTLFSPLKAVAVTGIESKWGNLTFETPLKMVRLKNAGRNKEQVIARAMVKGKPTPVMFEVPFGRGRMIYCALQLGTSTAEREQTVNDRYAPGESPELLRIYRQMLKGLLGNNTDFLAVAIPEKVMVTTLKVGEPGKAPKMVVNLLNATGIEVPPQSRIPGKMPTDWGKLTESLVFRIKLRSVAGAYAVSPDFAGRQPVAFREVEPGNWEFTVKPELLVRYTQVHIQLIPE